MGKKISAQLIIGGLKGLIRDGRTKTELYTRIAMRVPGGGTNRNRVIRGNPSPCLGQLKVGECRMLA